MLERLWKTHTELAQLIVRYLLDNHAVRENGKVRCGFTRFELAKEFRFSIVEDWIPVKKIILQNHPLAYGPKGHFIGEDGEGERNVMIAERQAEGWSRRAQEYRKAVPVTPTGVEWRYQYERRKEHERERRAK